MCGFVKFKLHILCICDIVLYYSMQYSIMLYYLIFQAVAICRPLAASASAAACRGTRPSHRVICRTACFDSITYYTIIIIIIIIIMIVIMYYNSLL